MGIFSCKMNYLGTFCIRKSITRRGAYISKFVNLLFLFDKLNIQKLSELIGNYYDVVFLDSITTLLTGGKYSYKDAEFAIPLYKLNDLACEKNIPIIFSSHLKKPEHNLSLIHI